MSFEVKVSDEALQVMYEDAVETFPNECCGFIYGDETNGRLVSKAVRVINSKEGDQRRRFEISPLEYMKAEQEALKNNLTLLGVYHSHPNHPAVASEHDLAKAMPYFSYIIVSVIEGEIADIKSWRLLDSGDHFEEEEVRILKGIVNDEV